MNKYEAFISYFSDLHGSNLESCPADVLEVLEEIKTMSTMIKSKPLLTECGMDILEYLQGAEAKNLKASDIAIGMSISSRKVSGAIRKLVTDSYVNKTTTSPVVYSLTEKGRNFDLTDYKKQLENDKEN